MDRPAAYRSVRPVKPSMASPTARTVGAPNSITSTSFDFHIGFFSVSCRESALWAGDANRFSQVIQAITVRPHQTPHIARKIETRTTGSIVPRKPNRGTSHLRLLGAGPGQTLKSRCSLSADRMPSEEDEMLSAMGVRSVEDLFADIPAQVRIPNLDIPDGLAEDQVVARVTSMLAANRTVGDMPTLLGGGLYDHFVPASVRASASRSEF